MLTLIEFIVKYFDVANTGNTPQNKGECTGLVSVWQDNLGIVAHEYGNAKDLLANADLASFTVIQNTPDNFPLPGDIIVWGSNWGNGFGHTGVVVAADASIFACFQQNNPTGAAPQILTHTYDNRPNGILGWLHPIRGVPTTDQVLIDQLRAARDTDWNLYQAELNKNITLEDAIVQKTSTIDTLTKENLKLKETVDSATSAKETVLGQLTASDKHVNDLSSELGVCNGLLANRKDLLKWSWLERLKSLFTR